MSDDFPISLFLNDSEEKVEEKQSTPEQALFDVVSGKKDAEKKEAERAVAEKLVSLMPKKEDPALKEVAEELSKIQEQISLKRASALGKDLVDVMNKSDEDATKEEIEQNREVEGEVKEKLEDIIQTLVDKVMIDNDDEERSEELEDVAVKMIRQFLQNDLFKLLRKQNDIEDGKYTYYSDEPSYNLFGGGGSGGESEDQAIIDELQKQLAKCKVHLEVLEKIYKSDVIAFDESPYQVSYNVGNVIVADATDGPITVILPPAVTNTNRYFIVKKIDTTTNPVNIVVYDSGTENIDGDTSRTITTVDSLGFYSDDGIKWNGVGDPDARACYYIGGLVWADYDPVFQWVDNNPVTTWADLETEELYHERERLLL